MQKRLRVKVTDLNPHFICKLCNGYLINPVTITECIHTFCKSCLLRHISLVNRCPVCNEVIHETTPIYNIRVDRTMQDIINKIFPKLEKEENRRERKFYRTKGLPYPLPAPVYTQVSVKSPKTYKRPSPLKGEDNTTLSNKELHHSPEQISLELEHSRTDSLPSESDAEDSMKELDKKFIRCSTQVTIGLLQRFLATKLNLDSARQVEICHDHTEMDTDLTLKYISDNLTSDLDRCHPLKLQYKT